MRTCICLVAGALMLTGCFGKKSANPPYDSQPTAKNKGDKFIINREAMLIGKVARVNVQDKFAVINFPVGSVPAIGRSLDVYRQGAKVGEVKVTGPQQEDNIVADIIQGEVQIGDELRAP